MENTSILNIADIFRKATMEVIERSCNLKLISSKTAQIISTIEISKDVGSFVSFNGNYGGLMVINFDGDAALEIASANLRSMGLPDEEIPTYHLADDVISTIGELTNHIVGKARTNMETKYDLIARSNIPAVVPVTVPIGLVIKGPSVEGSQCVRLVFRTPQNHHFHMEICSETALFQDLPD